jgi:hypothetical protein
MYPATLSTAFRDWRDVLNHEQVCDALIDGLGSIKNQAAPNS